MNGKSGYKRSQGMRFTALGIAFVFTMTSVTWTTPANAAMTEVAAPSVSPIEKLVIPAEMGSIVREYGVRSTVNELRVTPNASRRTVILIQDAHAVIDAQANIAKILGVLGKNYGVRLAALEGAKGRLEPILLRTFPDASVKRKILAGYENRAELSGPEMAAVLQEETSDFRGMEDWSLYEKNYFAYLRAQEKKPVLLGQWSSVKEKLDRQRSEIYDAPLNEFHDAHENFLTERASLLDLLVYLSHFKDQFKSASGYQELPGLISSIGYENSGKQEALAPLVRQIADEFKTKYLRALGVKTEMNFYNRYQSFMTGQITAGQMLQYLVQVGRDNGKTIKLTPALKKLLGHAELLSEIKGTRLYEELQRFLPEVEATLIKTPAQRELAESYQKIFLLKEMIELELTHEALEQFQQSPEAYLSIMGDPSFRQDLEPALEFYQAALARDQAFYKNIESMMKKQPSLAYSVEHRGDRENLNAPRSTLNAIAVVAGGFHTNGLERILKEKGVAYAVVTPKIASLAGIENYAKVMKGEVSFKDYLKTTYFDALMRHAAKGLVEALPIPDRVRTLKTWRDNVIRELAKEGRITDAGKFLPYIDELLRSNGEAVSVGPKRTKEEILDIVRKELEKFKKDSLERIWKTFEFQLDIFTDGLKGLVAKKELNTQSVSALLDRASQSKPSMLCARRGLAMNDPAINIEGLSLSKESLDIIARPRVKSVQKPTAEIQPQSPDARAETRSIPSGPSGQARRSEQRSAGISADKIQIAERGISQKSDNTKAMLDIFTNTSAVAETLKNIFGVGLSSEDVISLKIGRHSMARQKEVYRATVQYSEQGLEQTREFVFYMPARSTDYIGEEQYFEKISRIDGDVPRYGGIYVAQVDTGIPGREKLRVPLITAERVPGQSLISQDERLRELGRQEEFHRRAIAMFFGIYVKSGGTLWIDDVGLAQVVLNLAEDGKTFTMKVVDIGSAIEADEGKTLPLATVFGAFSDIFQLGSEMGEGNWAWSGQKDKTGFFHGIMDAFVSVDRQNGKEKGLAFISAAIPFLKGDQARAAREYLAEGFQSYDSLSESATPVRAETRETAARAEVRIDVPPEAVIAEDGVKGKVVDVSLLDLDSAQKNRLLDDILKLEREGFPWAGGESRDQWESKLSRLGHTLLVLFSPSGEITGVIYGLPTSYANEAEISRLVATHKDGISGKGTLLMNSFLDQMFTKGIRRVVWDSTKNAEDFYHNYLQEAEAAGILDVVNEFGREYEIGLLKSPLEAGSVASITRAESRTSSTLKFLAIGIIAMLPVLASAGTKSRQETIQIQTELVARGLLDAKYITGNYLGRTRESVRALQMQLFPDQPELWTGWYGEKTDAAVKAQKAVTSEASNIAQPTLATTATNLVISAAQAGCVSLGNQVAAFLLTPHSREEIIRRALENEKISRSVTQDERIRRTSESIRNTIEDLYADLALDEKTGLHNLVLYSRFLESKMGYWKIQRNARGEPILIAVGDSQIELATLGDIVQNYLLMPSNRKVADKIASRLGLGNQEGLKIAWNSILTGQGGNEAAARKSMGQRIASRMLDLQDKSGGDEYLMDAFSSLMFTRPKLDLKGYANPEGKLFSLFGKAYDRYYRRGPAETSSSRLREAHGVVSKRFLNPKSYEASIKKSSPSPILLASAIPGRSELRRKTMATMLLAGALMAGLFSATDVSARSRGIGQELITQEVSDASAGVLARVLSGEPISGKRNVVTEGTIGVFENQPFKSNALQGGQCVFVTVYDPQNPGKVGGVHFSPFTEGYLGNHLETASQFLEAQGINLNNAIYYIVSNGESIRPGFRDEIEGYFKARLKSGQVESIYGGLGLEVSYSPTKRSGAVWDIKVEESVFGGDKYRRGSIEENGQMQLKNLELLEEDLAPWGEYVAPAIFGLMGLGVLGRAIAQKKATSRDRKSRAEVRVTNLSSLKGRVLEGLSVKEIVKDLTPYIQKTQKGVVLLTIQWDPSLQRPKVAFAPAVSWFGLFGTTHGHMARKAGMGDRPNAGYMTVTINFSERTISSIPDMAIRTGKLADEVKREISNKQKIAAKDLVKNLLMNAGKSLDGWQDELGDRVFEESARPRGLADLVRETPFERIPGLRNDPVALSVVQRLAAWDGVAFDRSILAPEFQRLPSEAELMRIRGLSGGRTYPPGALLHTMPAAKFIGTVLQGFVEPTKDFEGNFNVHVSRADQAGRPSGTALSYGRGDWPVLIVLKPGLKTDLQRPGDAILEDTPKVSDILEVHVRGQRYTVREAYELITKSRAELREGEESEGPSEIQPQEDALVKAGFIKLDDFRTGAFNNPYWWSRYETPAYRDLLDESPDWDSPDERVGAVQSNNTWRLYLNPRGMDEFRKAVSLVCRLAEKYSGSAMNFKYRVVGPADKALIIDPSEVSPIVINFPSPNEARKFYAELSKMDGYDEIMGAGRTLLSTPLSKDDPFGVNEAVAKNDTLTFLGHGLVENRIWDLFKKNTAASDFPEALGPLSEGDVDRVLSVLNRRIEDEPKWTDKVRATIKILEARRSESRLEKNYTEDQIYRELIQNMPGPVMRGRPGFALQRTNFIKQEIDQGQRVRYEAAAEKYFGLEPGTLKHVRSGAWMVFQHSKTGAYYKVPVLREKGDEKGLRIDEIKREIKFMQRYGANFMMPTEIFDQDGRFGIIQDPADWHAYDLKKNLGGFREDSAPKQWKEQDDMALLKAMSQNPFMNRSRNNPLFHFEIDEDGLNVGLAYDRGAGYVRAVVFDFDGISASVYEKALAYVEAAKGLPSMTGVSLSEFSPEVQEVLRKQPALGEASGKAESGITSRAEVRAYAELAERSIRESYPGVPVTTVQPVDGDVSFMIIPEHGPHFVKTENGYNYFFNFSTGQITVSDSNAASVEMPYSDVIEKEIKGFRQQIRQQVFSGKLYFDNVHISDEALLSLDPPITAGEIITHNLDSLIGLDPDGAPGQTRFLQALWRGDIVKLDFREYQGRQKAWLDKIIGIADWCNFASEEAGLVGVVNEIKEIIKNAVIHGNQWSPDLPVFIRFDKASNSFEVFDCAMPRNPDLVVPIEWTGMGRGIKEIIAPYGSFTLEMDPNKGYTKATFTPNKSTVEERNASLFDHIALSPGILGILEMVRQGNRAEVRERLEERGRSELRKIETGFVDAATAWQSKLQSFKTVEDLRKYIDSSIFDSDINDLCKNFPSQEKINELIANTRNSVSSIDAAAVIGDGKIIAMDFSAPVRTLAQKLTSQIDSMSAGLLKGNPQARLEVLTNHSGPDSAIVLNMLQLLSIERLIVLHRPEQPVGRAFGAVAPFTPIAYTQSNPKKSAEVQVKKILSANAGGNLVALWTEDMRIGKVGVYTIVAELGKVADPNLKALACAAIRYIFLKYASLDEAGRKELDSKPDLILTDLNKMGFGSVIQIKGNTLVFDMKALADSIIALQSIEQAA